MKLFLRINTESQQIKIKLKCISKNSPVLLQTLQILAFSWQEVRPNADRLDFQCYFGMIEKRMIFNKKKT